MRNVQQLEGNDNSCKHMKVCRGMLLGVLQRRRSQPQQGILLPPFACASPAGLPAWPGISMSERVSPPKARTRFIYSIFFFCTVCTQKLFLTNCAAFCCSHASALSLSHTLSLSLCIVAANAALTRELQEKTTRAARKILWGFPNCPTS